MVSVCICTYNRCGSLERTLQSLATQRGVRWDNVEVIVVDNNCTDDTRSVVDIAKGGLPIRRVVETAQGLSHARNCGAREARGKWVLFTDDDVTFDVKWLATFADAFTRHPEAYFAGGSILPLWPARPPWWFRYEHLELMDGVLAWYELSPRATRLLAEDEPLPFGANFAVRRTLVDEIGRFNPDFGICGRQVGLGEETEFLHRARRAGRIGIYVGDAVCWHPVDPGRLTLGALYRYGVASGRSHRAIVDSQLPGSSVKALEFVARGLLQLCKGRGDRFRQCVINAGVQAGLSSRS